MSWWAWVLVVWVAQSPFSGALIGRWLRGDWKEDARRDAVAEQLAAMIGPSGTWIGPGMVSLGDGKMILVSIAGRGDAP